jgi:two-component system sensor histidine kinase/response regulator
MVTLQKNGAKGGEEILIIEDSPTQAEHLRYILENHSYRVSTAANGKEALAAIAVRKPALIISDIVMPEMDGYELCRRIKANEVYRDIPFLLLTALSDPQDVIRGVECGADNFITKPYDEEYLISRIRHLQMDRNQPRRENSTGGLELHFGGQDYVINADRRQILNLLLSTYETAILKNRELSRARDELNDLNEQLEAANRELESFSYTISHDLRGPVSNISGSCQVLMQICAGNLDEQGKTFLGYIEQETRRMAILISSLLNFSKLTSQEIHREKVELGELAAVIAADLQLKEPKRKVAFSVAADATCYGDPALLRAVLENLLGNAWKYTGKREEPRIEFGTNESEGQTTYFVRDNGAGFDMSQAHRLFATFQRLHSEEDFEGSGVGLATVQRIIQRHGGRVWAEGEVGKGATFYFTL